jgi:NAD(P)-dependent dehydrogenase (short-subunit alcohol dehydrogenase family)
MDQQISEKLLSATISVRRLAGKVAMVTGAGRGIGREVALCFAREGATVVLADINAEMAQAVAEEIIASGGNALAVAVDISDAAQVSSLVHRALESTGKIDILVNNAGIGHVRDFLSITLEEWNHVLNINLTGQFLCAQAVARVMADQGGGRIVNVASISGERGGTGRAAYGAAKAGVILLTKVMAVELAEKGIAVNAISPGPTETDQVRECHDDATRAAYCGLLPMRRYAQPAEIAQAALFLASQEASFVTGHILNVDGGFGAAGLITESR